MKICLHNWILVGRNIIKGKGITKYKCIKCGKYKYKKW